MSDFLAAGKVTRQISRDPNPIRRKEGRKAMIGIDLDWMALLLLPVSRDARADTALRDESHSRGS